jgi:hypothetical protein
MRLARGPLHPPFSVRRDPLRRCVYPTSATDPRHEHSSDRLILESPPPAAFAGATASAVRRPGRNHAGDAIEWSSLDDEPPASASSRYGLSVSRAALPRFGPVGPDQGPSETTLPLFPAAFSTARRGRDSTSDALCRDPRPRDVNPASKSRQDRFHRRPRQRTSASQAQDAFHRRLLADFCNQTSVREHHPDRLNLGLRRARLPSHARPRSGAEPLARFDEVLASPCCRVAVPATITRLAADVQWALQPSSLGQGPDRR